MAGVDISGGPDLDFSGLGFRNGECAVVSGAASGIGRAVARLLDGAGVTVLAWDIDEDGLRDLAAAGRDVRTLRVDGTDASDIARAWQSVSSCDVRYLANNAGPPSGSDFTVEEGVRRAIGGYAAMTDAFLAGHADRAESVVFTASTAGNFMVSRANPDWYPAAKAGIVGYMRHLAVKLGGRPRANAVAPGATITARTEATLSLPAVAQKLAAYPMGRAAHSWEVATAICFLLSPAASFVNGALLPVDGGSTWTQ